VSSGWRYDDSEQRITRAAEIPHCDCHSLYAMSGTARSVWEHSIAPVDELRYSITFRTLAN